MSDTFERDTLNALPDVMRFARSLEPDPDAAGDLVQETYLRAYRARDTFDAGRGARQWLFTICRNVFLRGRERAKWTVAVEDDAELEALASIDLHESLQQRGHGELFSSVDFGPALSRAMAMLPETHRVVFALVDVGGASYAEAAEELGIPVGTVRSRLFRARKDLQVALVDFAEDAGLVPRAAPGAQ